jgi:Flp pilus assembly protein TadD
MAALAEISLRQGIEALATGQVNEASSAFDKAHVLRPWDCEIDVMEGHAFSVVTEKVPEAATSAEESLQRAARCYPRSYRVLRDQAAVYEAQGNLSAADVKLTEALELAPHNPDVLLRLGVIAAQENDLPRAESLLLAAADSAPDSPAPWVDLARVYQQWDRSSRAQAAQDRAEELLQR